MAALAPGREPAWSAGGFSSSGGSVGFRFSGLWHDVDLGFSVRWDNVGVCQDFLQG